MTRFRKIALSATTFLVPIALATSAHAQSLPTGGTVTNGAATIDTSVANTTTINQTSNRAVINWNTFDVALGNSVVFAQPNAGAATLNRVTGATASTIAGQITANGSVYLINPNGISITSSGTVNVGRGFVASTLDIANDDFMADRNKFAETGGIIDTQGNITTGSGGYVALLGGEVKAGGTIVAPAGTVLIGTTTKATLGLIDGQFLQVLLPSSATLSGNGSVAALSAEAARHAVRHMINMPASAEATAVSGTNGDVTLSGLISTSGGHVNISAMGDIGVPGSVDVSGPATGGSTVTLRSDAIGTSSGTVTAAANSMTTNASGGVSIFYNPASYTAPTNYSGSVTGGSGTLNSWMLVNTLAQLQDMNTNVTGRYALSRNIDASATSGWNGGAGFVPVGNGSSNFSGAFDGQGYIISNLTINRPSTSFVGLFGYVNSLASITNVGLEGGSTRGLEQVGGLIGWNVGTVSRAYNTGNVSNVADNAGGLIGVNYGGTVTQSYATGAITGQGGSTGGLVGFFAGTLSKSYATGKVNGTFSNTGGLLGYAYGGTTVTDSYATGEVTNVVGSGAVGGLVGNSAATITNSYWDSYSTGQANGIGSNLGTATNVLAVTSDPTQSGASNYAFKQGAYANFNFGNDWFVADNATRPFLRSEYSTIIANSHQLQLMAMDLGTNYTLARNIDMNETARPTAGNPGSYSGMWSGTGFSPIGTASTQFTKDFDGQGHIISNLTIKRSVNDVAGLFGYVAFAGRIQNVGLLNGSIYGGQYSGALVAANTGTISHSYATSAVGGVNYIGGLAGYNSGIIRKSYATGAVSGTSYVGGLVGYNNFGAIDQSYSTGSVSGSNVSIGGFIGLHIAGDITNNYWDIYASGQTDAFGSNNVLIGAVSAVTSDPTKTADPNYIYKASAWSNFATGGVSDIDTVGHQDTVWRMYEGNTAPLLNTFLTPVTISAANGGSVVYNGNVQSTSGALTYSDNPNMALILGTPGQASGTNVGTYRIGSGAYTLQQGYDLIGGTFTITPKAATITGATGSVTYNGATQTNSFTTSGLVASDTVTGVSGLASGANAGSYTDSLSAATGSGVSNYTFTYVNGGLTINKAALTITGATGSATYNGVAQTNTFTTSGLLGSDTVTGVSGRASGTNVGSYTDSLSGATGTGLANYTISYGNGRLTINKATLTVTAANASRTYDGTAFNGGNGVTYSGFVNGQTESALGGTISYSGTSQGAVNAGSYTITPQGQASHNYAFVYVDGALNITARPITVTADAKTRVYGDANPALTYVVGGSGLVGSDTLSGSLSTSAGVTSNVGSYAINQGTLANSNYAISYTGANMNITPRDLTLTFAANAATRNYGDANPILSGTYVSSGLVNGDPVPFVDVRWSTLARSSSGVGSYNVNISSLLIATHPNYTVSTVLAASNATALTITARPITVTADAKTRVYGDANPALSYAVGGSGLVNGDTLSGGLATGASVTSNVGTYAIDQGTLANSNYAISYTGADLTVTPRAMTATFTANPVTRVYGDANPNLTLFNGGTFATSGVVNGDFVTVSNSRWIITATPTSNVGSYSIINTGRVQATPNYTVTTVQAPSNATALTITARPITVTADAKTRIYGDADPALSYVVGGSGLVNGDTLSGGLATGASLTSNVGTYAINQGTLANSNYAISYTGGDITITPRALSVVYTATGATRVYGDPLPTLTGSVTSNGLVNGDTLTGTATWTSTGSGNAGSAGIVGSGLGASSNYTFTSSQAAGNAAALTTTARPITVTADAKTRTYGDANPALTYVVGGSGLVGSDTLSGALTTSAGATSNVGTYAIGQGTLANSNYAISYTGGDITITPRALSVVYTATGATRVYGDPLPTLTGSVTSNGLVNGDTLTGTATWTSTGGGNAGSAGIVGSGLGASSNYTFTSSQAAGNAAALTTTARPITVTADAKTRTYGDANPALTYVVGGSGLVGSDTLSGALTTSAGATSNVGTYAINQGTLANSNYAISYTGGDITITPRALSVVYTATGATRVYGDPLPTLTGSVTSNGLVNGDTLTGTATWTSTGSGNAGSAGIVGSGLGASSNYTFTSSQAAGNAAALTTTARTLSVVANPVSRVAGAANPPLTYTSTGLVNGDALTGTLATAADATSAPGIYAITRGTLSASANYAVNYTGASLTVNAAPGTGTSGGSGNETRPVPDAATSRLVPSGPLTDLGSSPQTGSAANRFAVSDNVGDNQGGTGGSTGTDARASANAGGAFSGATLNPLVLTIGFGGGSQGGNAVGVTPMTGGLQGMGAGAGNQGANANGQATPDARQSGGNQCETDETDKKSSKRKAKDRRDDRFERCEATEGSIKR